MVERSVSDMLLEAAMQDVKAFRLLSVADGIHDSVVGFHAQQAVEKALKALLSWHRIEFRRTHDLVWLLDILKDETGLQPPHADWIDELNPYAVEARYGGFLPNGLDRAKVLDALDAIIHWVDGVLQSGIDHK